MPDADITLAATPRWRSLVKTYTGLAKGAKVEQEGKSVIFNGSNAGERYRVTLREQGKEDGVFITIASWRGK